MYITKNDDICRVTLLNNADNFISHHVCFRGIINLKVTIADD